MNNKAAVVTPEQFAAWLQGKGATPEAANTAAGTSSGATTTAMSS